MQISGWLYFFTWSLSFYPQFLLNWRTKSVVGLSLDYASLNLMGFMGYSIFNVAFFFDPGVQEQYRYNCLSIMLIVLACLHANMFPLALLMAAKKMYEKALSESKYSYVKHYCFASNTALDMISWEPC